MKNYFILLVVILLAAVFSWGYFADYSAQWAGVDETVVEKFAAEAGRHPVDPLINTDQGDLLLFVFLLAGSVGGFVGGYYFRILFHEQRDDKLRTKHV